MAGLNAPAGVTQVLEAWRSGDRGALPRVIRMMYQELRRAAAGCARRQWRSHTLDSTALLHEAYLALEQGSPVPCNDRGHFKAIVRRLMRQIASHYARHRGALRRGGDAAVTQLDETTTPSTMPRVNTDLEYALDQLRRQSPRTHLILEMHYRAGYSVQEIANATGVSGRTVERELTTGRTWLEERLGGKP